MSAIANIGNALRYDAVETAILTSFSAALALAALAAECRAVNDTSPDSTRATILAPTKAPRK